VAFWGLAVVAGCQPQQPTPTRLPASPIRFVDVATQAGLDHAWTILGKRPLSVLPLIGNGVAFLDYDSDENLDILLVGEKPGLFRGDGNGRFTNVSASVLPILSGKFSGCAVGDYDGDGFEDVYLSAYKGGALLHNEGGKRFTDATATAQLTPQPWGTACAFVETQRGSGRLDLIVGNYAKFGPDYNTQELCSVRDKESKPILTACPPRYYPPLKPTFFRNLGGGTFTDATATSGFDAAMGRTLGIAAADVDGSGQQSIALANDETEGDLFTSKNSKFVNIARRAGTHTDREGNVHGGMGTDWGDFDNDGRLDLFVATYANEAKSLYKNEGAGLFTDVAYSAHTSPAASPFVTFGCKFFDADNDGWLDLALANGHVQDNIEQIDIVEVYRQPTLFLHNLGTDSKAGFEDLSQKVGEGLRKPIVGRGLATGDFDNDGRVDLLIADSEGKPLLLHNETANTKTMHWLGLKLVGKRSNRSGYGAVLTLTVGGKNLVRHCHADGSYLSSSDARVHFGLGETTRINKLTIRWPSGTVQTLSELPLDHYTTIRES
jgi:enediyne biosynthesis protein E4